MSPIPLLSRCMSPVCILVNKMSTSSTMFYSMSPRMFDIHIDNTIVTSSCVTLCHQFLYCHFVCHQFVSWSIRCQQVRRCSTLCHQGCSTFILAILLSPSHVQLYVTNSFIVSLYVTSSYPGQ